MSKKKVIIIGTGFAGLCMAIRLKKENIHDFIILEQSSKIGGTWRDNDYPGAECDVHSHVYSFSFDQNPNWKKMFGTQKEILEYMQYIVKKYELENHIHYNVKIVEAKFNTEEGTWVGKSKEGKVYESKYVVSGAGGLSRPIYPDIKGIDKFKGKIFHTARWDHSYDIKDKSVAIIGTGASAIQVMPAIAPIVKQVYLYQRTPAWVTPKPDRNITSLETKFFNFLPVSQRLYRELIYWTYEVRAVGFTIDPRILKLAEPIVKKYVRKIVKDQDLAEKLIPKYTFGCKRILMSNDYYSAFNRDNVELVTNPIAEITTNGIKTIEGKERKIDLLVVATGFQAAEAAAPFPIYGKKNIELNEVWKENGAEAYLGTTVSGFPNLFIIVGPNTGLGHNSMIHIIESQTHYTLECIKAAEKFEAKFIDTKAEVQEKYNIDLQKRLEKAVWAKDCNSWYKTSSGKNTTLWPGFTFEFRARTKFFNRNSFDIIKEESSDRKKERKPELIKV